MISSDSSSNTVRVHIEFQRVQTWLFSAPRLRAMVGANALLGQVLREILPELAKTPEPAGAWQLQPLDEHESFADRGTQAVDPLSTHDDPAADAKAGILSRDGGHFEADFLKGAEAFAQAAAARMRAELPGLRFRISLNKLAQPAARTALPVELPILTPCEWTGRGLASTTIEQGKDRHRVSLDIARRQETAKDITSDDLQKLEQNRDLAQLLLRKSLLGKLKLPEDLEALVGAGYLALIHADGNGVGKGNKSEGDAGRARFFHRIRGLMRCALKRALDEEWTRIGKPALGLQTIVPLMLGGDDLLIACRADSALPLVVNLCESLAKIQKESGESEAEKAADAFELTLGVGVIIAKHSIPIHRLHEAAEQLASSAKRRFRGLKDAGKAPCSVVDWAVYSSSWIDAPEELRKRDWICGTHQSLRVLSKRPLDVCGTGLDSLQGLLKAANMLRENGGARSQLRYLVDQLPRGKMLAELAFRELAPDTRAALEQSGVTALWESLNGGVVTSLLDLVEVFEIPRLGRREKLVESDSKGNREGVRDGQAS
jgi:hypothetical protein